MELNSVQLIDRSNRPGVNQKVGLRVFFINDGDLVDPVDISGVTIFKKDRNLSPSTILNSDGLINTSAVSANDIIMNFGASANHASAGGVLDEANYVGGTNASGIYRKSKGEYVVVLDGTLDLSGHYDHDGTNFRVANSASTVADYLDVWTVKFIDGSDYQTIINDFKLFDNTFYTITEPLLIDTKHRLVDKHVVLGEKRNIKVDTNLTIANRNIDEALKNIFRDAVITSAMVEIKKINEGQNTLPSRVTVSSFADTQGLVDITAGNTLVFNWNTDLLATHAEVAAGNMGSLTGVYTIQVKKWN